MKAMHDRERRTGSQRRKDLALMRTEPPEGPDNIDRMLHAPISQFTQGISPVGLALAWCDWSMHLAVSPGKWHRLVEKAVNKDLRWLGYAAPLALPTSPASNRCPRTGAFPTGVGTVAVQPVPAGISAQPAVVA